ncbi:MAG: hypothetical protein COB17_03990 [Sulfurimonas sp.]|nr:MAG: hypothetical protein COB17_03990 [Sulfurimonas sp.]
MIYTFFIIAVSSGTLKIIVSENYNSGINKLLMVAGIYFTILLTILLFLEIKNILKLTRGRL